jgi:DNA polymerase-3 subunit delta
MNFAACGLALDAKPQAAIINCGNRHMMIVMDAMTFLDKGGKTKRQPVFVITGDEEFLKRRTLAALQAVIVGESDPSFAVSSYPGDKADFAAIRGELDTLPFLCEARLVVVEQADPFVTKFRAMLEKFVEKPATSGVLVLDVKSWPSNTKLAKLVPETATFVCKAPAAYKLAGWCAEWAKAHYGKKLPTNAAELLVDLVGPQMGLLDAELNKLAIYAGERPGIELADVDALVGRSRAANVFKIMDAVGDGKPAAALTILSELFEEGEAELAILGALGAQLRRLALAARLHRQGAPLDNAMDRAGVAKWPQARDSAVKQLKHLGWNRLDKLYDWLVEVDQGMKGGSPLPEKLQMERLIVRLARPRS